jgi:hypothetical protein
LGYKIKIDKKWNTHGYVTNAYYFSLETLETQTLMEKTKIDLSKIRYEVGELEMCLREGVNVRPLRI